MIIVMPSEPYNVSLDEVWKEIKKTEPGPGHSQELYREALNHLQTHMDMLNQLIESRDVNSVDVHNAMYELEAASECIDRCRLDDLNRNGFEAMLEEYPEDFDRNEVEDY